MGFIFEGELENLAGQLEFSLDIQTILLVVFVILPLVGIFAGIMLSVSIFARSYKEAQSYISSLNMIIILPAVVSFLPGIELNYQLAMIPVVNASLIMKEAMTGLIQWEYVLTAFAANFILAFAALFFCKKRFEQESVLFRT
jgi:sodium transport system permease protein